MRYSHAKAVVSVILAVWYFTMPSMGFPDDGIAGHVLYPLSHANIWHLLANIVCLWMIPCGLHLTAALTLAILCSFIPCLTSEVTYGFSGVLFAIVGISWGKVERFGEMVWRNKWFLIIPFFIPHINAFIHLYCMLAGYLWGKYVIIGKGDWL